MKEENYSGASWSELIPRVTVGKDGVLAFNEQSRGG